MGSLDKSGGSLSADCDWELIRWRRRDKRESLPTILGGLKDAALYYIGLYISITHANCIRPVINGEGIQANTLQIMILGFLFKMVSWYYDTKYKSYGILLPLVCLFCSPELYISHKKASANEKRKKRISYMAITLISFAYMLYNRSKYTTPP